MKYKITIRNAIASFLVLLLCIALYACKSGIDTYANEDVSPSFGAVSPLNTYDIPNNAYAQTSDELPASPSNTPSQSPMPDVTHVLTPNQTPTQTVSPTPNELPILHPSITPTLGGSPGSSLKSEVIQTFIAHINSSIPLCQCIATITYDEFGTPRITKIEITDANSGSISQTIIPPVDNEVFTQSAVYFIDLTFDGYLDLLIPYEYSARYVIFDAYIWAVEDKQFIEAPSFLDIWNPSIDSTNKQILSSGNFTANDMFFTIFSYQSNHFLRQNQFRWDISSDDSDMVNDMDSLMHCIESKFSAENQDIVNEFYVEAGDFWRDDKNDAQLKPYFEAGSFWDLNGQKWDCSFINELKY